MCQPKAKTNNLLLCLVHSTSSPTLSMAPLTKVLLFYLACSMFLCSFTTLGQATTNELFDEDPILQSRNGDQLRNEHDLASLINDNINWAKFNKLFEEKFQHFIRPSLYEKNKRDDDVPPGFIGVRGRRDQREIKDILRSLLSNRANLLVSSPEGHAPVKQGQLKKSDSNAYKDGFLGVRG